MLVNTPSGVNRRSCGAFRRARRDSNDVVLDAISNRSEQRKFELDERRRV